MIVSYNLLFGRIELFYVPAMPRKDRLVHHILVHFHHLVLLFRLMERMLLKGNISISLIVFYINESRKIKVFSVSTYELERLRLKGPKFSFLFCELNLCGIPYKIRVSPQFHWSTCDFF